MSEISDETQSQQQNPEQERDPRIPEVIEELSRATRLLQGPRPEERKERIIYTNGDKTKYIDLWRNDITQTRDEKTNLPKQINELKEIERIIPVTCATREPLNTNGDVSQNESATYAEVWTTAPQTETAVWLTLDKDNPQVFELLKENGRYYHFSKLIGEEKLVQRPDLLRHIVEAVSGKKAVLKHPADPLEWRNTFEPQYQTKSQK